MLAFLVMQIRCCWSAWLPCVLLCAVACDDGQQAESKIKELQTKAEERVRRVERDNADKIGQLQKQVEQLKSDADAQAVKLKAVEEALGKAEANAEDQAKAAETALKKAREAYKAEGKAALVQLNKEVTELAAKNASASAKLKAQTAKSMQQIVGQQRQIAKDLLAFDAAPLDGLQAAKAKLLQDLAKMRGTVRAARAKLG